MNPRNRQNVGKVESRLESNRKELVERIARAIDQDGMIEPLKGLRLRRASFTDSIPGVSAPCFCVIAQGSKEIMLGDERYYYDPSHSLLITAALPIIGTVLNASKQRPYLAFLLDLDPALVGSVMVESGFSITSNPAEVRAISVRLLDESLLEAVVRLVRLVDTPSEASFLMALVTREIIYRLLMSQQADQLRLIAVHGGYAPPIAQAIARLRADFDQPLRINEIARDLGMSVSGFHHHFKAVTAMSPLQFQKEVRLQEARRLMLNEGLDAASAGFRVGYNDASHFNREYKRLFGVPPLRDVERLRFTVAHNGSPGADSEWSDVARVRHPAAPV